MSGHNGTRNPRWTPSRSARWSPGPGPAPDPRRTACCPRGSPRFTNSADPDRERQGLQRDLHPGRDLPVPMPGPRCRNDRYGRGAIGRWDCAGRSLWGGCSSGPRAARPTGRRGGRMLQRAAGHGARAAHRRFGRHHRELRVRAGQPVRRERHHGHLDQPGRRAAHGVGRRRPDLRLERVGQGKTFQITAGAPGTYPYTCRIHPFMHGTLTVTAPSGGGFRSPRCSWSRPRRRPLRRPWWIVRRTWTTAGRCPSASSSSTSCIGSR